MVALALALAVVLYTGAVVGGRHLRARRRRDRARTPNEQVLVAWQETEEALALAGHARRPSETPAEFATRAAGVLPESGPRVSRLAADTGAAGFSVDGVPGEAVPEAQSTAAAVARELRAQVGVVRRLRWALDPRPLVAGMGQPKTAVTLPS
jgi:hypothetical protein